MADEGFVMIPVESSQIESMGFNEKTKQIKIRFIKNGAEYLYEDCTAGEFDAVVNADSVGRAFGATIKNIKPFRRLG
jgi:hypothetical protein